MSIVVTGATGQLGRLAVQSLLERGVPAARIVATGRDVSKLADLEAKGVVVRELDFNDPASLESAFAGATKLIFVSGSEVGQRVQQHSNVVDAAAAAGVELVAYTSIPNADHTQLLLAVEHRATEAAIRESGLPFVFLRNSWYLENYTAKLADALETGVVTGAAGDGRISAATRADYAAAAAAVVTEDGHAGKVYELGGDQAFTMTEFVEEITRLTGKQVSYQNLSFDDYVATFVGFGIPEAAAKVYADADAGIARGELYVPSGDLGRLIRRPTTSLSEALASALA